MKRLRVLSVIGIFLAFSSATAFAVDGMYMSGRAGLAVLADSDMKFSGAGVSLVDTNISHDKGFGVAAALGYQFSMVRVEGEIAYHANDMDEMRIAGVSQIISDFFSGPFLYSSDPITVGASAPVNGDVKALSFICNGYYDFRNASAITPYFGLGLGMARLDVAIDDLGLSESDNVFAYQIMVGAGYALSKQLSLEVEYRYFATQDPEMNLANIFDSGISGEIETEYGSHNVTVGMRMMF